MRIIYMGTPDFAVEPLKALLDNNYNIVGVVTMPDKPCGRGQKVKYSAVKNFALEKGLNLLQPVSLKDENFISDLEALKADLQIVVAFRMLPEIIWNMPPMGTINLHASLLPQYRGAAPINWAIINGEKETGVTTFLLQHEIDTGNILLQEKVKIGEDDNAGTIHDKLAEIGASLVVKTVRELEAGTIVPMAQNDTLTLRPAPKIFKEDCKLDFAKDSEYLHNKVRGLSPYPTAWFDYKGVKIKVYESDFQVVKHNEKIGTLISDNKTFLKVATSDGFFFIKKLQMPGKKCLTLKDYLLGNKF